VEVLKQEMVKREEEFMELCRENASLMSKNEEKKQSDAKSLRLDHSK